MLSVLFPEPLSWDGPPAPLSTPPFGTWPYPGDEAATRPDEESVSSVSESAVPVNEKRFLVEFGFVLGTEACGCGCNCGCCG